jgi:hypothetical protein
VHGVPLAAMASFDCANRRHILATGVASVELCLSGTTIIITPGNQVTFMKFLKIRPSALDEIRSTGKV